MIYGFVIILLVLAAQAYNTDMAKTYNRDNIAPNIKVKWVTHFK